MDLFRDLDRPPLDAVLTFGSTTAGYAWVDEGPAEVPAELARLLRETTAAR